MNTTDTTCVRIDADLTIPHAATLAALLREGLEQGCSALDLSAVGECDSAGIQLLCATRRSARQRGDELTLQQPSAAVLDALRRYGLDEHLNPVSADSAGAAPR